MRRSHGRILGGVAGGMADALDIDVVVVRVVWVIVAIASFGLGAGAYAVCWIAFPSEEAPAPANQLRDVRRRGLGFAVGATLLTIGLLIAFGHALASRPFGRLGALAWATVLIAGGMAVLLFRRPDDHSGEPPERPPVAGPTATTATATTGPDEPAPADAPVTEEHAPGDPEAAWAASTTAWSQHAAWPTPPAPPRPPRPPRTRSFLTPLTLSILLIGGGVLTLSNDAGTTHLTLAQILAGALCVVGVALVCSAWLGRARSLIPLGILLLLVTLPAAAIDVPLSGGVGNRDYAPRQRSELRATYRLGIGKLGIDLRDVPLEGRRTKVRGRLGIGNLVVDVPSDVRVVVDGHAGAGAVNLFGHGDGGWPAHRHRDVAGTARGELDLDLRVGAGAIQVHRFDASGAETILREVRT